jgi:hypothetical protein
MRLSISALSLLALALALAAAARSPVTFQKVTALTDAPLPPLEPRTAIDIAAIVRAIPDRGVEGSADTVYEVLPERRYRRSVVEGLGNCSNLVKGLTWALIRDGYAFEVIHFMPIESFLVGDGHTLLRAKLVLPEGGEQIGLADVAAAALPRSGTRLIDLADLSGDLPDFHLDPLRPESEDWSRFYGREYHDDVAIGRISADATARWYRFLEAIYLDVGLPERADKILYVGIGVALGIYPPIHVQSVEPLRSRHPTEFAVMTAALWTFRVAPLLLLGCAISWLAGLVRAHSLRRSHSRILRSRVL